VSCPQPEHTEDAADDLHLCLVNLLDISGGIELEPVPGGMRSDYLSLTRIAQLTSPTSLGYLEALEAGSLVEYAVGELAFRTVVAAVAKRSELGAMLVERLAQMREVRGLTSEPVVVLRQHRRNAPAATRSLIGSIPDLSRLTAALPRIRHSSKTL
jgi:hypothetical protein